MRMRAILVVVAVAVAALAQVALPGRGVKDDAAAYRHYLAIGERACEMPTPTPSDGFTVWTGLTTAAIKIPRTVPAEQRRAIIAGCNAAR